MHETAHETETGHTDAGVLRRRLPRNVLVLGAVSFFTDVSSEMIYPLLPLFLSGVLGAPATFVGAVEGAAETTAAMLKLASGWWSDRVRHRKPLVVVGYVLATVVRPLVAVASAAWQVLAIRVTDRVGKGIRTAPRDALIGDSVDAATRGRAFGFHRGADHAGAVVGPLLAYALLQRWGLSMRAVFALAAVPGLVAVLVLVIGVRDVAREPGATAARAGQRDGGESEWGAQGARGAPTGTGRARAAPVVGNASASVGSPQLGGRFWTFLAVVLVFTLGNSTDAFLLLRANQLGVATALAPILWAMLHVVKSAASTPAGALSDRLGRKPLIVAGWVLYGVVYLAFGRARTAWQAWALFAVYGIYFGLTEGVEKALVVDIVPPARRGAGFGWYNLAIGVGALPASLLFGYVWDAFGAPAAFGVGATLAGVAAVALALFVPGRPNP